MPRSPKNPTIFLTTSSNPGTDRSVCSAARSAGCSHDTGAIWVSILRGRAAGNVASVIYVSSSEIPTHTRTICGCFGRGAACCAPTHTSSVIPQRLIQIRDEVLHVLDPDRQPHQAVGEPHAAPHVGRHARMGHRGRMADQAFYAAERFRERKDLGPPDEAPGNGRIAQLDADHPAEALHLTRRQVVLRMRPQSRIVDALDSGVLLQPFRDA